VSKQINAGPNGAFSERVKGAIHSWRSLIKRCQAIIESRRKNIHFANFCTVYEPAHNFLLDLSEKVGSEKLNYFLNQVLLSKNKV
jgi:hypothetical protein